MKFRTAIIATLLATTTLLSCTKVELEPVDTCTFNEMTGNASNPHTDLYQELLDEYTELGLPGISIAIETSSDGWWVGTSGMASIEDDVVMKPCHLQHSASMAKPYIATLIMSLVEDGSLDLDDPIRDYLPQDMVSQIANAEIASIRQLLNHTSGIFNFDNNMKMYVDTFNDPLVHKSIESVFEKYIYGMPPFEAPGGDFHYSNTAYSLLGMIVEEVSGMTLGDYMEQEIIAALGLQSTYYKSSPGFPEIANTVNSYFEHYPGQLQNCTDIQMNFTDLAYGHEGIIATPYDYAVFIKELMTGNILEQQTVDLMINASNRSGDTKSVGLGIKEYYTDYGSAFGHTGGSIGSIGYMMYFPESEVSFCMTSNVSGVFGSENTKRFQDELRYELLNVIFKGERL